MLELKNISKSYGAVNAVSKLSMLLEENDTIAVLGESGSGKSTLLRLICGLEIPDNGSIEINGTTLNSPSKFVRPEQRKFGLVFQDNALFPHLTIAKNILFGISKNPNKMEILKKVLDQTFITGLEKRYPHELSGGQQQRVAIARALAIDPQLLLLDEPFSGLDRSLKSSIRSEISKIIKAATKPTIIVTHNIEDAIEMANKIAVMKDGELVQFGSIKELYEKPKSKYVAQLFGEVFEVEKGEWSRIEHIHLNEGNLKAQVIQSSFYSGNYQIDFKYKEQLLKAYSLNSFETGSFLNFSYKKIETL